MQPLPVLTERITSALERFNLHYGLARLSGSSDRVEKMLSALVKDAEALADLVIKKPAGRQLTPVERITTLAEALEQVTHARGNRLYQVDGLHECATQMMPADVAEYWTRAGAQKIAGHITSEREIASQLEARGILVWRGEIDGLIRLVNTNWLTTHAAIRERVTTRVVGRRCRFCRIQEPDNSRELIPVDPARRGKLEILDGVVQLQTKQIHAHLQCIPHWQRWLSIAEQYKSREEAEAADVAAGRTAQPIPALLEEKAVQPSGEEPQHFNSEEQR